VKVSYAALAGGGNEEPTDEGGNATEKRDAMNRKRIWKAGTREGETQRIARGQDFGEGLL
jgi:hypothetical protein